MDNYKKSSTGLRRPVREADHSPPTNIKFHKEGSYVPIPPYAFRTYTGNILTLYYEQKNALRQSARNKDDAVAACFQLRHDHSPTGAEETK